MAIHCPYCSVSIRPSGFRPRIVQAGRFRRKSDCKSIQRFRCLDCLKHFSTATFHPCYRQNKRVANFQIIKELSSGVSLRRAAIKLNLSRTTLARKLTFLGLKAQTNLHQWNTRFEKSKIVEFDELETFEHSKCKPLSVALAVEHKTRRILAFKVARMPAKGRLVKKALKLYGPRQDERKNMRLRMFKELLPLVEREGHFKSDQNPFYPRELKRVFPDSLHEAFKGQRGSIVGQGELKKIRFDPLFSLNHTCAMLRANINRLIRKTWCTTKVARRLELHIAIYAYYHNKFLINSS